jgi:nucleoside-diphosphate-sugar epimerase
MNVFLTGATGHLGGELLVMLSKVREIEHIYCLVRSRHGEGAHARLGRVSGLHGDDLDPTKILPVEGDLLRDDLARSLGEQMAGRSVDVVLHSAANTSFSPLQAARVEKTNIGGLRQILKWAATLAELRTFLYVGTASICGKGVTERLVLEGEAPNPGAQHLVRYTQSKLEAEVLVREALRPDQALIVRPSILLGDRRGLVPRSVDVLWAMAAINELRLIPVNPRLPLDIVPVDYAAQAIVALLFARRNHDVYHVSAGAAGATTTRELAGALSRRFLDLPPFQFISRASVEDIRLWIKGRSCSPSELDAYDHYLGHWTRRFPSRAKLLAILAGLAPYFEFMQLGQVFDNARLLGDTRLANSEPAHVYLEGSFHYLDRIDLVEGAFDH